MAGKIGDICLALAFDIGEKVPPLNCIIVSEDGRLPNSGVDSYLERFLGFDIQQRTALPVSDRAAYAAQIKELVLNDSKWRNVATYLDVPLPSVIEANSKTHFPELPNGDHFALGGESSEHQRLKQWIAERPELFKGFGDLEHGSTEFRLMSGDRVDTLFENADTMLAVEVKTLSAAEDEAKRGVFQCVKYRATLRATQLVSGLVPNAQAVLALHGYRENVASLSNLLQVETVLVVPGRI